MLRRLLGWLISLLVRLISRTQRLTVVGEDRVLPFEHEGRRLIWVFWHGRQMLLHGYRRPRGYVAMISHSRDGDLQAAALRGFGVRIVRGSSSRGGAAGLVALAREIRNGHPAMVTADGPRGPIYCLKPGVVHLARATGALLVPVGGAVRTRKVLARAWDRFRIPWPFTRTAVVIGEPLEVPRTTRQDDLEGFRNEFETRLRNVTREADKLAGHEPEAELGPVAA